ncbi:hypothetical protein [Kitasatospora sp. NPDC002040]|uniref:hypothetical protein n=1 Tax=Kitasatospora sp. NPDC002040 TaxID=3154661 RepID=UPI003328F8C8
MDSEDPRPPEPRPAGEMPVADLVADVVDDVVRTASLSAGRWLADELEQRGDVALWEGMLTLLRPLAARPVYDLPEREGIDHLRRIARGPAEPVTALIMGVSAAFRELGEQSAREVWQHAPAELRHVAVLRELISRAYSVGSRGSRLAAVQVVALVRETLRPVPVGHDGPLSGGG